MPNEVVKIARLKQISEAIVQLKVNEIAGLTNDALKEGMQALEILSGGLIPGMSVIGDKFKNGEIFLPELLLSSKTMKTSLEILSPILSESEEGFVGRAAVGTVKGDIHDIGKNIVISILEGNGFDVIDIGIDVDPENFVEVVGANDVQILGLSALLTSTMPMMEKTIEALEKAELRQNVKVLIGGAPVTQNYADRIGADGYGADAVEAVEKARVFISESNGPQRL